MGLSQRGVLASAVIAVVLSVGVVGWWLATRPKLDREAPSGTVNESVALEERSDSPTEPAPARLAPSRDMTESPTRPEASAAAEAVAPSGDRPVADPGGIVTGRVVDGSGQSIEGVGVHAHTSQRRGRTLWSTSAEPTARTDERGEYRLRLDSRRHDLFFSHPRHARGVIRGIQSRTDEALLLDDLVLGIGGVFAGRVVDVRGRPIEGVTVAESSFHGNVQFGDGVKTDADGRWRIELVDPGIRIVKLSRDGYATRMFQVRSAEGRTSEATIELEDEVVVSGRVVDEGGKPIEGAWVRALPQQEEPFVGEVDPASNRFGFREAGAWLADDSTVTDAAGRFEVRGLRPGAWRVSAHDSGFAESTRDVEPGVPVEIVLSRELATILRGRVTDAQNGEPIRSFTVSFRESWGDSSRWDFGERVDGGFEAPHVEPGTWTVVVAADGYREAVFRNLMIAEGETNTLDVRLESGAAIEGVVRSLEGPIGNATVVVWHWFEFDEADSREPASFEEAVKGLEDTTEYLHGLQVKKQRSKTNAEGRFRVGGLGPGPVSIRASHPEFVAKLVEPVEVPSRAGGIEIVLGTGGAIEGTVFDASGFPIAGARVLATTSERGVRPVSSDGLGVYRFDRLQPGEYRLGIARSRKSAVRNLVDFGAVGDDAPGIPVTVVEGEVAKLDLRMLAGGSISGVVRSGGVPRPAVAVLLYRRGITFDVATQQTTDAGRYEFVDLEPGVYALRCVADSGREMHRAVLEVAAGANVVHDIELPRRAIRGRVLDSKGRPVADVDVTVVGFDERILFGEELEYQGDFGREAVTDEEGRFDASELGPGRYRVAVRADTWFGPEEDVTVDEDEDAEVELRVELGGAACLRPVDAHSGEPLDDWVVSVEDETGIPVEIRRIVDDEEDSDFAWDFCRGVRPGEYRLRYAGVGYTIFEGSLEIEPGVTVERVIRMSR